MTKEHKFTTVSIPAPLFKKIEKRIKGTGFPSVSSFVAFVMREVILSREESDPFSTKDREKIKERLEKLGYL
jgi:Arc/MetJ-type ribon-helix-helix transcriptional regulator